MVDGNLTYWAFERLSFLNDEYKVIIPVLILLKPTTMLLGQDHIGMEEPAADMILVPPGKFHG